jgi:transposase InsO family protein
MKLHIGCYSMAALCEGLQVSRSGYYAWCRRGTTPKPLDVAVQAIHAAHQGKVGAPYITAEVHAGGLPVSERTVGRSLHKQGLKAQWVRPYRHTTDSNPTDVVSPNLLARQFTVSRPNQVWVGDITYLQTTQGWLYLAVMIDLFSRQVVGWQMSSRIDQTLVNEALQAALRARGKPQGVMIHTDRGSQYCAASFRQIISQHQLVQSMSRKGNCWDNAVAESFFASLKKQRVYGYPLTTRDAMTRHIFEYLELYYNRVRRHSANNWLSPVDFERLYHQHSEQRAVY